MQAPNILFFYILPSASRASNVHPTYNYDSEDSREKMAFYYQAISASKILRKE
jgi:hypothetical protein